MYGTNNVSVCLGSHIRCLLFASIVFLRWLQINLFGYAVVRDGFVVCAVAGHFVGRMSSSGAYDFLGGACKIRGSFLSNLDNQHLQW